MKMKQFELTKEFLDFLDEPEGDKSLDDDLDFISAIEEDMEKEEEKVFTDSTDDLEVHDYKDAEDSFDLDEAAKYEAKEDLEEQPKRKKTFLDYFRVRENEPTLPPLDNVEGEDETTYDIEDSEERIDLDDYDDLDYEDEEDKFDLEEDDDLDLDEAPKYEAKEDLEEQPKRKKTFLDYFRVRENEPTLPSFDNVEGEDETTYDIEEDDELEEDLTSEKDVESKEEPSSEFGLIRELIKDQPSKENDSATPIEDSIKDVKKPSFLDRIQNVKATKEIEDVEEPEVEESEEAKPTYEELEEENEKLKRTVDKLTKLYDKYLPMFEEEIGSRDQRIAELEDTIRKYETGEIIPVFNIEPDNSENKRRKV
ncbi:MAG: hypothetical protein IKF36_00820 [Bacilli bacterium]|nr:hypothetical protein [Bacilli bacterium]